MKDEMERLEISTFGTNFLPIINYWQAKERTSFDGQTSDRTTKIITNSQTERPELPNHFPKTCSYNDLHVKLTDTFEFSF